MKSKVIQVRINSEQEDELRLRAHSAGMTVSEYLRHLINLDINKPELLDDLLKSAENLQALVNRLSTKSI